MVPASTGSAPAAHRVFGKQNEAWGDCWYESVGHAVQASAFPSVENVPGAQSTHDLPSVYLPGGHVVQ